MCTSGIGGSPPAALGTPGTTRNGELADRQMAQDGSVPDGRLDLKKVGRGRHHKRWLGIAEESELEDPRDKIEAELVKEVANDIAGDGTITAVLAQALDRERGLWRKLRRFWSDCTSPRWRARRSTFSSAVPPESGRDDDDRVRCPIAGARAGRRRRHGARVHACGHARLSDDAIATRYCQASRDHALDRDCICAVRAASGETEKAHPGSTAQRSEAPMYGRGRFSGR
jgi:hypothetical protein